jgi:hypothetical protein
MTTAITANRQALATINRIARVGSGAALGSGAEATAFKSGLAKPRCACGASLRWTLVSEYVAVAGAIHSGGLMDKRFWISGVVLTIVWMILAYIVNWVLLKTQFDMTNLFRSDAEQMRHVGWLVLADLLIGFSLTWIYRQGNTTAPVLGQGLRFGIAVAALAVVPIGGLAQSARDHGLIAPRRRDGCVPPPCARISFCSPSSRPFRRAFPWASSAVSSFRSSSGAGLS